MVLFGCMMPSFGAQAHHAVAGSYDQSQMIELDGRVTEILWRNPHVQLSIAVTTDAGSTEEWELASTSLSNIRRWQIPADFIEVGDEIRVAGNPAVRGQHGMYVRHVLTRNGEEVLLAPGLERRWSENVIQMSESRRLGIGDTSAPELGMFRIWSTPDNIPVLIPRNFGNSPPIRALMTDAARREFDAFVWERDNPLRNCAPKGMPTIMEAPYPFEFRREGDDILWHNEEFDTVRIIHLGELIESAPAPSLLGYSVGTFENDNILHVTTTAMNWGFVDAQGLPLSADAEVRERFTLSPQGDRLDYRMRIIDPANFREPVELTKHWVWYPDAVVGRYECALEAED